MIVSLVLWFLKRSRISLEQKGILLNGILDKLAMLPLRDIIQINQEGMLVVNEVIVDRDKASSLRDSAKSVLLNEANTLVDNQVLFEAFNFGINSSVNFEQIYSAKMAVWWGKQRYKHLTLLAGYGENGL